MGVWSGTSGRESGVLPGTLAAAALGSTSSRYRAMRMYMDMPLEMGVAAKAKAARIMVGIRHKSVRGQIPG